MLSGLKKHTAEPLVPESIALEIEMVVEKINETNHQVLIKFQQKLFKQEVGK
jgi:hypothetical protein